MRLAKRLASGFLLVTILFGCIACSAKRVPVEIEFLASWDGQALSCSDAGTSLTDLRFYVFDIALIDTAGRAHEMLLTGDGRWQREGAALIDLENGEGACSNGTHEVNPTLSGMVEIADFDGVRFTIGVPFEANHANPLLAAPPLDDAAMHWHWRSGYKFLRTGVATPSDSFWIHLGSTGCKGTVQNISGCRFPNRVTVQLSDFSPHEDRIAIDLAKLFRSVDLDDGVRSDCSSGPAESACAAPFEALGLAFGDNTDTSTQIVFQVRH